MNAVRPRITDSQRRARLWHRHCLSAESKSGTVGELTDAVVALHASDPASVYLSALARLRRASIETVDAALFDGRSVVRHHAMRRTLWVMTPPVARSAHGACTVDIAIREWNKFAAMLEDAGVASDGTAWCAAAREETIAALRRIGAANARDLAAHVPRLTEKLVLAVGKPYEATVSAHSRVLQNLGFDGEIVRGRPRGGWNTSEFTWNLAAEWIEGGIVGEDRDAAVVALARRYLGAFGPVTTSDLQWWTGWTAATTNRALAQLEAVAVDLDAGMVGWVLPGDEGSGSRDVNSDLDIAAFDGSVVLLPALDPTAMGWKQREFYLGDLGAFNGPLFDRNGNVGPTVWLDGRVVGGWAQTTDGEIVWEALVQLPVRDKRSITEATNVLAELVGLTRFTPRFPTPLQKRLSARAL